MSSNGKNKTESPDIIEEIISGKNQITQYKLFKNGIYIKTLFYRLLQ